MKDLTRIAITLARVSTKEQEEEGYSVDAQTEFLEKYCATKQLDVIKRFKIAETASKPEMRKEFQNMLDYMENNKIQNLVVEKVDRLTRNSKSAITIDDWLDGDPNRKLHLPKNGLILHKLSTSQDRFMWDIYVAVAKQYANNLREEVRKGVYEKLRQGWYPGTHPPIGYLHSGEKGHKIQVIDPETSPLVKLAFELYDTGNYSIDALTEELKNQGLISKSGKALSKSYLHLLLHNKFYVGTMTWLGKEFPGNYETFIEQDLFDRVQERLTRRDVPVSRVETTLLKGKARCGGCGSTISWYQQKGHWYGECKSKKKCGVKGCARLDGIEIELSEYFDQLIAPSPAIIAWVKKELRQSHEHEFQQHKASVDALNRQQQRLDRQIKILYDDRLDGRIDPESYDRKFEEKTKERDEIIKNLERLNGDNTSYIEKAIEILDTTQKASEIFLSKPLEDRRILLGDIFSNITLNGKHLEVEWRPAAAAVRKASENTKRLEEFLEPSVDPSKFELTAASRSEWLPLPVIFRTKYYDSIIEIARSVKQNSLSEATVSR